MIINIVSGNGLTPVQCQAITLTNDDTVDIYNMLPGLRELSYNTPKEGS